MDVLGQLILHNHLHRTNVHLQIILCSIPRIIDLMTRESSHHGPRPVSKVIPRSHQLHIPTPWLPQDSMSNDIKSNPPELDIMIDTSPTTTSRCDAPFRSTRQSHARMTVRLKWVVRGFLDCKVYHSSSLQLAFPLPIKCGSELAGDDPSHENLDSMGWSA